MMNVKTIFSVILGLGLIFLISAKLIIPFFGTVYERGYNSGNSLKNEYCVLQDGVIPCINCNSSSGSGYSSFLSSCDSLIDSQNNTHCYGCSDFGFKSYSKGLFLMILVIGFMALVMIFRKFLKIR